MTRPPDNPQPPPEHTAAAEPGSPQNAAADGQPALIAALNMTEEVEADVAGELIASALPAPQTGTSRPEPP